MDAGATTSMAGSTVCLAKEAQRRETRWLSGRGHSSGSVVWMQRSFPLNDLVPITVYRELTRGPSCFEI